jgi:hypothetical protein
LSYLEKVESFFVKKRKKGLIISPKDWLVIEKWQQEGIPLDIVLKGIENTFKNVDSSTIGGKSKIHRLSYCEAEIRNLWEKKAAAPGTNEEEFSSTMSFNQVVNTLEEAAAQQEGEIAQAILQLAGEVTRMRDKTIQAGISAFELEIQLREELANLADRLQTLVDQEELKSIRRAVENKLQGYRRTMEVETYRKTFHTLLRDRLLESVGISELSVLQ